MIFWFEELWAFILKKKIKIFGIDTDKKKINSLKNGKSYINLRDKSVFSFFKKNTNNLSTTYEIISKCDFVIICLTTTLKTNSTKTTYS